METLNPMSFRCVLPLLGVTLIAVGVVSRDWRLSTMWLGSDFLALGIAYGVGSPRVFGKRSDGTIPAWSWLVFMPLLVSRGSVWHMVRLFQRGPALHAVTDDLAIGRRLLPSEIAVEFDNYVDLTAEFAEPLPIRRSSAYISFPILDGTAPTVDALRAAVAGLRPGTTFVHCAQGYGRTGLFALAVLLKCGAAGSVEEGLRLLQAVRPGVRLNRRQRACIESYAEMLR